MKGIQSNFFFLFSSAKTYNFYKSGSFSAYFRFLIKERKICKIQFIWKRGYLKIVILPTFIHVMNENTHTFTFFIDFFFNPTWAQTTIWSQTKDLPQNHRKNFAKNLIFCTLLAPSCCNFLLIYLKKKKSINLVSIWKKTKF